MSEEQSKPCSRCKKVKLLSDFSQRAHSRTKYTSLCKECLVKYSRWRYRTNKDGYRDQQLAWARKAYQNLKALVIQAYGGMCWCCGEREPKFLTIDHIFGDGAECRRAGEGQGGALYCRLKREGFPQDRYRLACYNCNCSRQRFGECPHQIAKRAASSETIAAA